MRDAAVKVSCGRAIVFALVCLSVTARAGEPQVRSSDGQLRPIRIPSRVLDPATWPVVPIPNISVDPTNGATVGIIPTRLQHGRGGEIDRIIAPDIIHNAHFGWGGHLRVLNFPSPDTQWSIVAGVKQRIESNLDARYETGLLRRGRWSLSAEADYDRSGTARFFGIGNESRRADQTVYIDQQLWFQMTLGWNVTHAWQLAYTFLAKKVKIIAGHLPGIVPITRRFPNAPGLGTTHELLQRISVTYDTRDDITMPRRGVYIVVYGGIASRDAISSDPLFTEAGADGRFYWSPHDTLTLAAHVDLRYMPSVNAAPFWALSSIGGDHSVLGGQQTLRGYGDSRFYGRDSFAANLELRQRLFGLNMFATRMDFQIAPFFDTGRVFSRSAFLPLHSLHNAVGVGFRGVAPPYVVGYVDVGYGSEGAAVFTGINYPF